MRALVVYTPANKTITAVQDVPGGVISVNSDKNHVIEDTEILKPLFVAQGYSIEPIEAYELSKQEPE